MKAPSERIMTIFRMVSPGTVAADIGTDHGMVPVLLMKNGVVSRAVASDVRKGPLLRAKKLIEEEGLEDRIDCRLGDGLQTLSEHEADRVIIAGMGGGLIVRILEESEAIVRSTPEFVLSPHSDVPKVREYLFRNGFSVADEEMVLEDGKYYTVIRAVKAGRGKEKDPDEQSLLFGPVLLKKRTPVFLGWLSAEEKKTREILEKLERSAPSYRTAKLKQEKRHLLEMIGVVLADGKAAKEQQMEEKAKVLFTREITAENVLRMYEALGKKLTGKIAVKVHSGEDGNQNFLKPEFWKPVVDHVGGTVVECNTAYGGARNTTAKHLKLIRKHGWSRVFSVDLMDAEGPDMELPILRPKKHLKSDIVGKNLRNYDSMLVLAHFKGHPMGGFGGALKQLSIGVASTAGKVNIHSAGKYVKAEEQSVVWNDLPAQDAFLESMAEAASAVVDHFAGEIVYVNVMANMSVDCDCCAVAEDPCLKDIGILASLDPVAIDRACLDLVKASKDIGREHFMERVNSRNGEHTIDVAEELGIGTTNYELVELKF